MFNKLFVVLFSIALLGNVKPAKAQEGLEQIKQIEDSLVLVADSMYHAFIPDERIPYAQRFIKMLVEALKEPNSWAYEFPELKETINIMYPEDKAFRIFNWAIAPTENTRRYYGAVQMPGEELKLYPLIDYSGELKKCGEDSVLTHGKWYGVLFYKIIAHEIDGETVYTMFGLNSSSPISNKKVLDPMKITEDGLVFGAPIFNVASECTPNQRVKRFIIEYKKDVQASMNWDESFKAIVFDRLVSQVNDPNRKYTFVPSGAYDGFKWKGDEWSFMQNLIPIEIREDGEAPTPVPKQSAKDKE